MNIINNFKLLDNLDGYDKLSNPMGLNTFQLLPHGVTWLYDGKKNVREHANKIIALPLYNNEGIALIQSPFDKLDNQAFIIKPNNEIKWNISEMIRKKHRGVIFSDVYYITNTLFFFVNIDNLDYRFTFDPETGMFGDLIPSY